MSGRREDCAMNDYAASVIAYLTAVLGLWLWTRRSEKRAIRYQWRKLHGVLIRTAIVFLILHFIFAGIGLRTAYGYLIILVLPVFLCLFDLTGVASAVALGIGFAVREWIFWFPSRREFISRNPGPEKARLDTAMMGMTGVALTDLKPTGVILIEGTMQPARAVVGFISKGDDIAVESVGAFEFRVKKL
jgi:hypothetical protein